MFPCNNSQLVLLLSALFGTMYISTSKEMYDFIVSRMTCGELDPRLSYNNHTCSTKAISRTVKSHNIRIWLYPNVTLSDINVKVNYFHKVNNVYRRSLISAEEDFCGFLKGTAKSYLIRILWPFLKKASNLKDACPYSGLLNITGLVFEDTLLPPALPEGSARIDIHVKEGPERWSLIKVQFYIDIKPKGALRLEF